MKILLFILLFTGCNQMYGQNLKLTFGRGTDCFGRGACSITQESRNFANAEIIEKRGALWIRIYTSKLSATELDKLNFNHHESVRETFPLFTMEEDLIIPTAIQEQLSANLGKSLQTWKSGYYRIQKQGEFTEIQLTLENSE